MTDKFAKRTPETALDRQEDYAAMTDEDRKRRAARALRSGDEAELWAMVESYHLTFGRKGLRTSAHTLLQYRYGLRALLAWCADHAVKPHQLTRQDALRFVRAFEADGMSPATCNARVSGARAVYAALVWSGMADGDPFARVSVTDPTPSHEKREHYSTQELDSLLAVADPRERAIVLLSADGGLRVSESIALVWGDLDATTGRIVVRQGKGGKRRTVQLTQRVCDALGALGVGPADQGILPVTRQRVYAILAALCERAGVTVKGIHALRHTCGTRLYAKTHDLVLTARHLGHSSTRPTEGYAHLADEAYVAGVAALETPNGA